MKVQERAGELADHNAAVLVVTFAAPERIPAFREALGLDMDIAADPDRSAYRAYGMGRGKGLRVWHPKVWLRYARLIRDGMAFRLPARGEDLNQLGGDFVLDGRGRVVFSYRSAGPEDRPDVSQLLDAVGRSASGH